MGGNSRESRRVLLAGVSACVALLFLIVFTAMVYSGKRKTVSDLTDETGPAASLPPMVSMSDEAFSEENVGSAEDVSSEEVSSVVSSEDVSDTSSEALSSAVTTEKSEPILNPDNKSKYYIVV